MSEAENRMNTAIDELMLAYLKSKAGQKFDNKAVGTIIEEINRQNKLRKLAKQEEE